MIVRVIGERGWVSLVHITLGTAVKKRGGTLNKLYYIIYNYTDEISMYLLLIEITDYPNNVVL